MPVSNTPQQLSWYPTFDETEGFFLTEQEQYRFWRAVEKTDGCWIWHGNSISNRDARFCLSGKVNHGSIPVNQSAYKVSYFLHYGVISSNDNRLRHSCNNNWCVRPDHLYLLDGDGTERIDHINLDCDCPGRRCPSCEKYLCYGMYSKGPQLDKRYPKLL